MIQSLYIVIDLPTTETKDTIESIQCFIQNNIECPNVEITTTNRARTYIEADSSEAEKLLNNYISDELERPTC